MKPPGKMLQCNTTFVDCFGYLGFCFAVKLTFRRLQLQLAHTWTIARSQGTRIFDVGVVELRSEDGTTGMGEAAPTARYKESVDTVETFFKRVDPRRLSFEDVTGGMNYLDT